jgi:hypothetical protein
MDEKCLSLIEMIQALRKKKDMVVETYDNRIESLRSELETYMKTEKIEKARGDTATAYFTHPREAKVTDWNNVLWYVKEKNAFDILERRISVKAIEARLQAGEIIPGVTLGKPKTVLNIRALKEKEE